MKKTMLYLFILISGFAYAQEADKKNQPALPMQEAQESSSQSTRRVPEKERVDLVPLAQESLFEQKRAERSLNVYIENQEKKNKELSLEEDKTSWHFGGIEIQKQKDL